MSKIIGGRFEIAELIGEGGMGEVYRGHDKETGQEVAIKALKAEVMESDPDLVERFKREADALSQLNHPNIIRVIASLQDGKQHYIVMEYLSGGDLQSLIKRDGQLPLERAVEIALDLADALTRAHRLKIIHRDIKPANVLLAADGTPRLTDFGIAHMGDRTRMTETGMVIGTYSYLSPEAIEGEKMDERSDIWAFGVMLFLMLTGKRPFDGDSAASMMYAIIASPPADLSELRPDVPDALVDLLDRILIKDRNLRISSIRQVGAELETILQDLKTGSHKLDERASRFYTPTPFSKKPAYEMSKAAQVPQSTIQFSEASAIQKNRGYLSLALVILVLLLIIAAGVGWVLGQDGEAGGEANTDSISENATPVPTLPQGNLPPPPRELLTPPEPVAEGEYMVLVADLEPIGVPPRNIVRFIFEDLRENLEAGIPFSKFRIRHYHRAITSESEARRVAEENHATIIIWGNFTEELLEVRVEMGVLDAFPYIQFESDMLEASTNVRVRLTDERNQSLAPQVLSIVTTLHQANGDIYDMLLNFAQQDMLDVQTGEIIGDTAAAGMQRFAVEYVKDKEAALEGINSAIELNGANPLFYTARAVNYLSIEDLAAAESDARTAARLSINTNWIVPDTLLANIAIIRDDLDTALELYNRIIEKRPNDWYGYNYRGSIYYLRHEYDLARADYDRALELEPTAEFPYVIAAMLALRAGEVAEAKDYMNTVLTKFPDTTLAIRSTEALGISDSMPFGHIFAAFGHYNLARYEDVIADTEAAIAIRPDLTDMYYMQGAAYCNLEDYEAAIDSYSEAIELEPDFALLYLMRASVLNEMGDRAGALADLAQVNNLNPSEEVKALIEAGMAGELSCQNFFEYQP